LWQVAVTPGEVMSLLDDIHPVEFESKY